MSTPCLLSTVSSVYNRQTVIFGGRKGSEGENKELFGCLDPLKSTLL